ncbi:MAG: hypothetical protein KKA73_25750 [Chloroflexi bacterium]|nr:hypothetical protein [Chloroflexota bacterium]MBU1751103.1 hypothetical protein [Chloroflexota bacterium]
MSARQRLAPQTQFSAAIHWVGLTLAAGSVILSRALHFTPGYVYGAVGALALLMAVLGLAFPVRLRRAGGKPPE